VDADLFFGADSLRSAKEPMARILVVDDEERIRLACLALLRGNDRIVEECATGREALARLAGADIDVVVLDLGLPDINGRDVMEWMSLHRSTASVIVFSADEAIDSAIFALRRGACEFIRKNSDPENLIRTVDDVLRRRLVEREHSLMLKRLEQSERLHRFLVDHSPDIIFTLDTKACFTFINNRVRTLLGHDPAELVGLHFSSILAADDIDDARHVLAGVQGCNRETRNHEVRLRVSESHAVPGGGPAIVAILSCQAIHDGSGDASARCIGTTGVLRDITDRKLAEARVAFQASHDLLTGLPNRALFRDRLMQAILQAARDGRQLGLMFIDLDHFKLVNDTCGHAGGDEFLRQFAGRVRSCLRKGDTLARLGGDEFTVLLPDVLDDIAAEAIAAKVMSELALPFVLGGREVRASASIGIATYPGDGDDPERLLAHADIAMYQIKAHGKNGFLKFSPAMVSGHGERVSLENEMRAALERREFRLHYQPQVSVGKGRVIGVEALARWPHPERGMISPARFVQVAEESGLIFSLSDWVIDEACRQMARWLRQGYGGFKIALNVSPIEFERDDFIERMIAPAERHDIPTELLDIEITENLLIKDAERAIDKVRELRRNGVGISIDDFGTRFSSLNYLRRFDISTVKIDQSFVQEIASLEASAPVISAVVEIARGFQFGVLAEGVESQVQKEFLTRLGCDSMQGYLFSRPCEPDDVSPMLPRRAGHPVLHERGESLANGCGG
jgi:diguanylate cyclase (GGDEF)-like protein/PAS domain S-box-containing protein